MKLDNKWLQNNHWGTEQTYSCALSIVNSDKIWQEVFLKLKSVLEIEDIFKFLVGHGYIKYEPMVNELKDKYSFISWGSVLENLKRAKLDMRFKSNKLLRRKHRVRFLMLLIFIEIIFLIINLVL